MNLEVWCKGVGDNAVEVVAQPLSAVCGAVLSLLRAGGYMLWLDSSGVGCGLHLVAVALASLFGGGMTEPPDG